MTDPVAEFLARVDRLESRYRNDRYADVFVMPRELMLRLRDAIRGEPKRQAGLFDGAESAGNKCG
jgi:hypothetical protein